MGLLSGSVSLSRWHFVGEQRPLSSIKKRIKLHQGEPIGIESSEKEERVSWVLPKGLELEEELEGSGYWGLTDLQVDGGLLLRMRIERRKVPSELLAQIYKAKLTELREERAISKQEQRDLKESVKADLISRALPAIGYIDGYWKEERQELILFSTGKKNCELFCDLFIKTFGMKNSYLLPYSIPFVGLDSKELNEKIHLEKGLKEFEKLVPSNFIVSGSHLETRVN